MKKELRKRWYSKVDVQFELVKFLKGRETAFLGNKNIRNLKIHSLDFFKRNSDRYEFISDKLNLYHSLALLNNMPMFSFDPKIKKIQSKEFNKKFSSYMIGYDFGLDLDESCQNYNNQICDKNNKKVIKEECKNCIHYKTNFNQLKKDAIKIKNILLEFGVGIFIVPSGSGIHIDILNQFLPEFHNMPKQVEFAEQFKEDFREFYKIKTVDPVGLSFRKMWKTPLSYDIKTDRISIPLTPQQLDIFNYEMINANNVIDNNFRDHIINHIVQGKKSGFIKLCEEIMEKEKIKEYIK